MAKQRPAHSTALGLFVCMMMSPPTQMIAAVPTATDIKEDRHARDERVPRRSANRAENRF
jgi:hypothetical protein